jgi:hypothetical protein
VHFADRVVTELGSEQGNSDRVCEDARLVENLMDGAPLGHAKGSSAGAANLHAQECTLRSTNYDSRPTLLSVL